MRTLIVSDLHLGSGSGSDVLGRPEPRAALLEALQDVDRLVLLGDVLELRHGPPREAMAASRPFFEDLGGVFGAPPAREVVLCAGNHDHLLVDAWLDERALQAPEPLSLEQRIDAETFSPMLERIAEWLSPARLSVAYPGLWVRPDVYATHGHYLDCHLTVPTLERLSVAVVSRMLGRPAGKFGRVEDYEAVTGPVLAVAALNRAGLGPLRTDISIEELRRAGLRAMGEVADRLQLGDSYVVFGHTHRAGPLPGDPEQEWHGSGGARLVNSGCWTYDSVFLSSTPGESPYWPGTCVLIEDEGPPTPPVLKRLLLDRTHAELAPGKVAGLTPSPA
jgi:Calcineurin-like phosphoesterase